MKKVFVSFKAVACVCLGWALSYGCGDNDQAGDALSDAGVDSGFDTETELNFDTDTDGACQCADNGESCPGYPAQCDWDLGKVVTNRVFASVFGSGGDVVKFDMCEVFKNRDKVKSLVFAVGQQD